MAEKTLPVVDYRELEFSEPLGRAFEDLGFIELMNHPVDLSLLERAYALGEQFFNLSPTHKKKYVDPLYFGQRGYSAFGLKKKAGTDEFDDSVPEFKEAWQMGRATNLWPLEYEFQQTYLSLFGQLENLSFHVLDACSSYLGQERSYLRQMATEGTSFLRVLHYPALSEDFEESRVRMSEHEDLSLVTLLCAPTVEGLQILGSSGEWISAGSAQDSIVINVGELLSYLTHGVFKSAVHRVVRSKAGYLRRLSIPFFVIPDDAKTLSPVRLPNRTLNSKKTYVDILTGEYLRKRIPELPTY